MKILWASNGPHVGSGYGVQTKIFVERLIAEGHEVVILAFYGLQGSPIRTEKYLMLPSSMDQWSNDVLAADYIDQKADILLTLMDAWVFREDQMAKVFWTPWFPVDHDPLPPAVQGVLSYADVPIAYSQFGHKQCLEHDIECLYVPHGIDTSEFYRMPMKKARERRGVPEDIFFVGLVAANKGAPSRKAFEAQIRGFKLFHDEVEDSILYLHTEATGVIGEDIHRIIELVGLDQGAVAFVDQYGYARGLLNSTYMNEMYNSMDVLLNATRGEGFGVPIIEAQAAGVPAIVTNFTAMPELAYDNLLIEPASLVYTSQGSYQASPDAGQIASALRDVYKNRQRFQRTRAKRAKWVAENYSADVVTEKYWRPALDIIEAKRNKQRLSRDQRKQIVEVG